MKLSCKYFKQIAGMLLKIVLLLLLNLAGHNSNHYSYHPHATPDFTNLSSQELKSSLKKLNLNGHLSFENTHDVANDFGNIYHFLPIAVLKPKTVSDIATTIKHVFSHNPELTITPRGHGHSLHGQSQGHGGILISMESLQEPNIVVQTGKQPYVEVSGGELWINILHETLKHGLTPRSWTDYLYLTVGGTLSNAGISGQAFRHGPQINNVQQLEVVTGKGDVVKCSEKQNTDLFNGVLGGLGQFGIITKARISLEPAAKMVKWIRVLYSDFNVFTMDQEQLISSGNSFDYIEGFVIINRTGLVNNWRSTFSPKDPVQASKFSSQGKTLYCLEMAMYFNSDEANIIQQKIEYLLSELNYIPHTLFQSEVSYVDFLNRVHLSEIKLREKRLWEVPHPWLNLLVPKSKIHRFAEVVFGQILTDTSNGPILIYPVNQSRWNAKTSMVTPAEDVFYLIAFLSSAIPSSSGSDGLENILTKNKQILDFCEMAKLGMKQYLPNYDTQNGWRNHFGSRWNDFARRKQTYDPLSILTPGQRIFHKGRAIS